MQGSSSTQQLSALSVLLEHPGVASDHLLLCSAAMVCSSWRDAVAASGAGTTNTVVDNQLQHPQRQPAEFADTLLTKISGFATWLPKHASAVHSISVSCSAGGSQTAYSTACQVLTLALRLATAGPQPLQLQHFASNISNSEVLAVLPAGLTALALSGSAPSEQPYSIVGSLEAALDRITQLQSLSLCIPVDRFGSDVKFECLAKHTHLTRLCLKLQGIDEKATWESLQQALAGLPALQDLTLKLKFDQYLCDDAEPDLGAHRLMGGPQLSSLVALTRLELDIQPILPGPGDWFAMPPKLQELTVLVTEELGWQSVEGEQDIQPIVAMNLTGLKHLRRVTLRCGPNRSMHHLTGTSGVLRKLNHLDALDIHYDTFAAASQDSSHWVHLFTRRLKGLSIIDAHAADGQQNGPFLQNMLRSYPSLLCGLTRLELSVFGEGSGSPGNLQVCANLTKLTKLQRLRLDVVGQREVRSRDCLHLTGMGTLTSLALRDMRGAVDDMVAVALACTLSQLCYLDLTRCFIQSDTPMPAFAHMRHLTKIVLTGNRGSSSNSVALLQTHRCAAGLPSLIVLK